MDTTKNITELTGDELQQRICILLAHQEKHLRYFSTVLTVYLVLTGIAIGGTVLYFIINSA